MRIAHPSDRILPDHVDALAARLRPLAADASTHPLVTLLGETANGERLGLLWWPTPDDAACVPVVSGCGPRLRWWSASPASALHRWLASEDAAGRWHDGDAEDAARVGYRRGAAAAVGLDRYLALAKLDPWDASLARALRHIARGDALAARVAGDRDAARAPEWGAALRTRWAVAVRLGDGDVAREAATAMMGLPLWTFEEDWASIARWSGWREPIDAAPYRRLAMDPTRPAADRAAWWLDVAAAEDAFPSDIRDVLRTCYLEAGLQGFAAFVGG
ncbi:MAG: hypothetical protein RLZZ383_650 [Pseudomonadota bacterium]|jgi:hypothetical protein